MPLASSGVTTGLVAARHATRLPDPRDDDHAFLREDLREQLPDLGLLPLATDLVRRHERRQEANVRLRHLAAGVGDRHQRHVERALAQRAELRVDLDERRVRIDLELEAAVGLLLDVGGELAHEAVAEIAGIDGPAGELVRNLERGGRLAAGARTRDDEGNGSERPGDEATARDGHDSSKWWHHAALSPAFGPASRPVALLWRKDRANRARWVGGLSARSMICAMHRSAAGRGRSANACCNRAVDYSSAHREALAHGAVALVSSQHLINTGKTSLSNP